MLDISGVRARKREELLRATEAELDKVVAAVRRERRSLRGTQRIALRVGRVLGRFKVAKHFTLQITDSHFSYARDAARIAREAATDGIYVIRTNLPAETMDDAEVVTSYKSLALVEHAFRSIKTVDLEIRPIYHWLEDRVRAHVMLCMLAYYVEWHMRRALRPMLYEDEEKEALLAARTSPVTKAPRSDKALAKEASHRTPDGLPVHSFQSLLADLGTLCLNTFVTALNPDYEITLATRPTPVQAKAFECLGISAPAAPARAAAAARTQ